MSQDASEPLCWVGTACVERGNELVEQEIIVPPVGEAALGLWQFEVITCSECQGKGMQESKFLGQPDTPCPRCQGRKTLARNIIRRKDSAFQGETLAVLERIAGALEAIAPAFAKEAPDGSQADLRGV